MMPDAGLRTDQAPPLAIPASFFLLSPLAMIAAGVLLFFHPEALAARWSGAALALTHLGTLGLLGSTMLGALYQLIPVVAGAPVPAIRLAHGVHAFYLSGLVALVGRFLGLPPLAGAIGLVALGCAFLLFFLPVAVALFRAPSASATPLGLRVSVVALLLVVLVGLRVGLGHAGGSFAAARFVWAQVHLSLGLLGWVGGLLAAAAWQLVPMFYLAPSFPPALPRLVHGLQALGLALLLGVLLAAEAGLDVGVGSALLAAAPLALGVWLLGPAAVLRALLLRKRARADGSVRFWLAGAPVALALPWLGAWAVYAEDPRWGLAFAWLALWGHAATILHGMLTRILPFLTWFHRFSRLLGKAPVPPMRALYPDSRVRIGWGLHVATTLAGLAAVVTGVCWPVAVGLVATGAWLGWHLGWTLLHRG